MFPRIRAYLESSSTAELPFNNKMAAWGALPSPPFVPMELAFTASTTVASPSLMPSAPLPLLGVGGIGGFAAGGIGGMGSMGAMFTSTSTQQMGVASAPKKVHLSVYYSITHLPHHIELHSAFYSDNMIIRFHSLSSVDVLKFSFGYLFGCSR